MKATSNWAVWQRGVPAGIGSLGYAVGDGAADGIGEGSVGEGVGTTSVAAGLAVGDGDAVATLDGGGVQPATAATTRAASRPTTLRFREDIFNDLTDGLAERNALH